MPPIRPIIQRPRWYPNIRDAEVQEAFRLAFDHLYHLQDTMQKFDKVASVRLTKVETSPNLDVIVRQLQIGGSAPLNVTGLLGILAQPQVGSAATGTATPSLNDPISQTGALFVLTPANTLYYFKTTSEPGAWTTIAATGVIQSGLRSAKPAAGNTGYTYFETDTGWYYYDNGTNYLYLAGINKGTDAARTALTIGTNDNGALFYTTDTNVLWRVSAGAWTQAFISLAAGVTGLLPYANGGTNVGTAWAAGSIFFAGATTFLQDNANLFWDNTNKRLGIGTALPTMPLSIAEKFQVSSVGIIPLYNNIATVKNGVPSEYATVDLTAQGAAIGATTLYAVPASGAGAYRITFVAKVTQAATTSSKLGGAGGFQLLYTDADDSVVVTTPVETFNSDATTLTLNTTQAYYSGILVVNAKALTNIQYQMGYTSVGATPMQFNLHIRLEAL